MNGVEYALAAAAAMVMIVVLAVVLKVGTTFPHRILAACSIGTACLQSDARRMPCDAEVRIKHSWAACPVLHRTQCDADYPSMKPTLSQAAQARPSSPPSVEFDIGCAVPALQTTLAPKTL